MLTSTKADEKRERKANGRTGLRELVSITPPPLQILLFPRSLPPRGSERGGSERSKCGNHELRESMRGMPEGAAPSAGAASGRGRSGCARQAAARVKRETHTHSLGSQHALMLGNPWTITRQGLQELASAEQEAEAVCGRLRGKVKEGRVLTREQAAAVTGRAVKRAAEGAGWMHVSCHAEVKRAAISFGGKQAFQKLLLAQGERFAGLCDSASVQAQALSLWQRRRGPLSGAQVLAVRGRGGARRGREGALSGLVRCGKCRSLRRVVSLGFKFRRESRPGQSPESLARPGRRLPQRRRETRSGGRS